MLIIYFILFLASFLILLSFFISRRSNFPTPLGFVSDEGERKSQYECGFSPLEEEIGIETRERFYLKFFLIALIFLIFDIETLLAFPISLLYSSFILKDYFTYSFDPNPNLINLNLISFFFNHSFIIPYMVFFFFILFLLLGLFYEYRRHPL